MNTPLAILEEDVEVTVDGEVFAETRKVGGVTRAYPKRIRVDGEWVENTEGVGEFIRLHLFKQTYLWAAPLDDYDAELTSLDPALEPRWEAE